ncbi:hypothetical protein ACIRQQ_04920 [Streptomyces fuscichromogenes]|uniref:hypothetical protein n=1 Tax=Streptomyces fuscichromogenes TaxID=1324013 RepID=UPI00380CB072
MRSLSLSSGPRGGSRNRSPLEGAEERRLVLDARDLDMPGQCRGSSTTPWIGPGNFSSACGRRRRNFAQAAGQPGSTRRIVLGQYLGFAAILAVAAALEATFLPGSAIPYLGLLPLALGLKAAWQAWKDHHDGGDNIGVYVPVFATRPVIAGTLARRGHVLLPLVLVAIGLLILVEGGAFGL